MSDEQKTDLQNMVDSSAVAAEPATTALSAEKLDEIEDMDFLLEEIENKIAPLALA